MGKALYLDLISGISGDMFVGALIDLGVDPHRLEQELAKLGLGGYHLHSRRELKNGIAGIKFDVHVAHAHPAHHHDHDHDHDHGHGHGDHDEHESHPGRAHTHPHPHPHQPHEGSHHHHSHGPEDPRAFAQIRELILHSPLSDWVKEKSVSVFERLAVAEGKIHGLPPEQVAFHEVGALDSIVDIVGACVGLDLLGRPRVLSGPAVEGTGWIDCEHGRFPIPAPATLAVLGARGIAVSQCEERHELITPTGAALLAEFAESFGPMRNLVAEKIGFGLGTRDLPTRPNVLRVVLGEAGVDQRHDWETDTVAVIETDLDDVPAEVLGHVLQQALDAGALDVFHTPIQMKKNRPGVLLTVLCAEADTAKFAELILRQTSAFGVRFHTAERRKLRREFVEVETPMGSVTVKLGRLDGQVVQVAPEFESCKALADRTHRPLREIYDAVRSAWIGTAPPRTGSS